MTRSRSAPHMRILLPILLSLCFKSMCGHPTRDGETVFVGYGGSVEPSTRTCYSLDGNPSGCSATGSGGGYVTQETSIRNCNDEIGLVDYRGSAEPISHTWYGLDGSPSSCGATGAEGGHVSQDVPDVFKMDASTCGNCPALSGEPVGNWCGIPEFLGLDSRCCNCRCCDGCDGGCLDVFPDNGCGCLDTFLCGGGCLDALASLCSDGLDAIGMGQ